MVDDFTPGGARSGGCLPVVQVGVDDAGLGMQLEERFDARRGLNIGTCDELRRDSLGLLDLAPAVRGERDGGKRRANAYRSVKKARYESEMYRS